MPHFYSDRDARPSGALRPTTIIGFEELLAVKLARDLYNLAWFSTRAFAEALVRRLAIPKIWRDGLVEE